MFSSHIQGLCPTLLKLLFKSVIIEKKKGVSVKKTNKAKKIAVKAVEKTLVTAQRFFQIQYALEDLTNLRCLKITKVTKGILKY